MARIRMIQVAAFARTPLTSPTQEGLSIELPAFSRTQLQGPYHRGRRTHRSVNIILSVRRGNKPRLKLRRRKENSFGQHAAKKFGEFLSVALYRIGKVVHRLVREIGAEHRTAPIERHRHTR